MLFKIILLTVMAKKQKEIVRHKKIFHLLSHTPNSHKEPSFSGSPMWVAGTWAICHCCPRYMRRKLEWAWNNWTRYWLPHGMQVLQ